MKNYAGKIHQGTGRPVSKKLTSAELEAAERAKSTGSWIKADIVNCQGCIWWRRLGDSGHACHYMIETDQQRPVLPKDCYKHEGTPYRPKGG